jgi:hypothetical protein
MLTLSALDLHSHNVVGLIQHAEVGGKGGQWGGVGRAQQPGKPDVAGQIQGELRGAALKPTMPIPPLHIPVVGPLVAVDGARTICSQRPLRCS